MNPRRFTTRTSAHGSDFVALKPEIFNMTREEAVKDCDFWRSYAVGGDAIIVENINGLILKYE